MRPPLARRKYSQNKNSNPDTTALKQVRAARSRTFAEQTNAEVADGLQMVVRMEQKPAEQAPAGQGVKYGTADG